MPAGSVPGPASGSTHSVTGQVEPKPSWAESAREAAKDFVGLDRKTGPEPSRRLMRLAQPKEGLLKRKPDGMLREHGDPGVHQYPSDEAADRQRSSAEDQRAATPAGSRTLDEESPSEWGTVKPSEQTGI